MSSNGSAIWPGKRKTNGYAYENDEGLSVMSNDEGLSMMSTYRVDYSSVPVASTVPA